MPKKCRIIPSLSAKDKKRFWSKVDIRGPGECWPWQAAKTNKGYGAFGLRLQTGGSHEIFYAHRVAWTSACGPVPPDLCVLHRCDNRLCCNPAHFFLGTVKDNNVDAAQKGRTARGEQHGRAKSTEQDIWDIRAEYAAGDTTQEALGCKHGLGNAQISRIVNRKSWAHI